MKLIKPTKEDESQAHAQALIAIKPTGDGKFKDFLPLVNQIVVYTSTVLPVVKAKKEHKKNSELTESILVQTVADATGTKISDLEKNLPSAEDMLTAMVAIGNVMGGSSGYNPILMLTNLLGKNETVQMIDELVKFPLRFPDPSEDQLVAAEQVILSVGLGFGNQETSINSFLATMTKEQTEMIDSLQKNVIEKAMSAMMTSEGEPSPALVEEIKRQMREMNQKKGSTDLMPDEFKDLVKQQSNPQ